jgi:hypothetical protein
LPTIANGHAVDRADRVRREHRVAEIGGAHVLGEELDSSGKILRHDLLHPLGAERELPVAGHHVDAEELAGVDHVLALRPQRRRRSLPRVAAVEKERLRARRFQSLDESCEVREAADLAVGLRRGGKVEIRERMRVGSSGRDAEILEQTFADEMRRAPLEAAEAQVDARLAVEARQELRVAVREVEQAHVAERRDVVHSSSAAALGERLARSKRKSRRGAGREHVQEFAPIHSGDPRRRPRCRKSARQVGVTC